MTEALRKQIRQRAHFACEFCGVSETDTGGELTIDHFRLKACGGSDGLENLLYCFLFETLLLAAIITQPCPTLSIAQTLNVPGSEQQATSFIEPYPITTHPESDIMPALSPDGKWLAYVSRANKNYDIWVKPAAGGLATPLTTNTSDDFSPAWSPDGKALAFISRRDDAEGDLYWLEVKYSDNAIAPGKTRLLQHDLNRETFPAVSPDGKRIAFSFGPAGQEQIWLYDFRTKRKYPLTKNGGTQPAWSPDGKQLAIACPAPNTTRKQIFLIQADTAEADRRRVQITFAGENGFPTWAPDGRKILVQRIETDSRQSHLRIIALAEGAAGRPHELQISPPREESLFPFWGSDHAIYFTTPYSSSRSASDNRGNFDIWRIPEAGLSPPGRTAHESFTAAQAIAEPEVALLAFSALGFYFPDSAAVLCKAGVEIGRRYLALGDTLQARTIFTRVVKEFAGAYEAASFAEIELAKLARAPKRLDEISSHNEKWPVVQAFCALESGKALQNFGELEAALRYFEIVSAQYPDVHPARYEAWLRSGDILLQLNRAALAEAAYLQIVTNYRERAEWQATAVQRLLTAALRQEITGDTSATYQRVMQKYSDYPAVAYTARLRIAGRLLRDGEIQLAENEYQSLIALLADQSEPYLQTLDARTRRQLMRLHIYENDFPAAAQVYLKLFEAHSGPVENESVGEARRELTEALIRRARVLVRARDYELALVLFRQARQYDPKNIEAHRGYVGTMQALGDIGDAIAEYENANPAFARFGQAAPKETASANEVALYALGLAYSYKGESNLGLLRHSTMLIERALRIDYRLIPAYLTLSFNYEATEHLEQKERQRKKGFFEKIALAVPEIIDKTFRAITLRPPKPPALWYEKAIDALTSAIALNDESVDPEMEARIALNLANNYYNLGEFGFDYALQYFQHKLRYDSTFVSSHQKAIIFERIGECAWATRRYDQAIAFLQTATRLCHELRDVDGELRNLNRLALVYQSQGDFDASNEYFAKVDTVSRRENRPESLALVWRNMAFNHLQNRESDDAVTKSERSAALLAQSDKSIFPQPRKSRFTIKMLDVLPVFWMGIDPFGESNTEGLTYEQEEALLHSITGESYAAARDFANAIDTFEKKAETFHRQKNLAGEARSLNNLGLLWYSYHEFEKAYEYFSRSFTLCDRLKAPAGKIINLINMGNLSLLAGNPRWTKTVDSLLQTSRPDIEQISLQAPRQKLAMMNTLGNFYLHAAQRWLADEAAHNGSPANGIERTYRALQHLGRAHAAYDTALAVAQAHRLPREEIIVRRNLASLCVLSHDYALALTQLKAAHDVCIEKNLPELTWRVEHAIGTVCRFVRLPSEHPLAQKSAIGWYRDAIDLLEGLPEEPEGSEQRFTETEEQSELYENAVALLAEQNQPREALELAERARSNRFINLISTRYVLPKKERHRLIWGGTGGMALDVQRTMSRLRGELARLESETPPRPKEIIRHREALAAAEREYQGVLQAAFEEDPELTSFFSTSAINSHALQDSLDTETAMLAYFVVDDELLIWLISRERFEPTRVPVARRRLQDLVAELRRAWSDGREDGQSHRRELSALLLGGVRGLEMFRRLIIVPDDCLHYLPFAALEYDGEPLVDLFTVAKTPSLLALKFAERHQNLNENNLLIVQNAGDRTALQLADQDGIRVQYLRGADWRDGEPRQKFQQAGIMHMLVPFAVQPRRPLDSGFRLQLAVNANTAPDSALVPLSRLFEFDLAASLIALANTNFRFEPDQALRGLAAGDEMIALQRSLIYAGTPTIVLMQWPVAPKVSELFFTAFYTNLSGQPAVAALNAAQHAVREQFPDPYDWAGFELIGFPGMSSAEKSAFANRHFEETVLKGNEAQEMGEFLDAVRYYQSALTMAQQLGQPEAIQNLYLLIKGSAISGNDYATACEIETKILDAALAANNINQQARSYRNLAVWQLKLKNYEAAAAAERERLALAERLENPIEAANSQLELAQIYETSGDYVAAMSVAEQAAKTFTAHQQILSRLQAEAKLGALAMANDQPALALDCLERGLRAFLEARTPSNVDERRELALAYQLTGKAYSRLTGYEQALTFHQKALADFETIADTVNITRAEHDLADTYWLKGDFQDALVHEQRALKTARTSREKLLGHTTLGLILLDLGEFDAAFDAEKQALQLAFESEATRDQATIYKNLGKIHLAVKQYQRALSSFYEAIAIDRQLDDRSGLLYDYLFIGQTFQALAQPDSAPVYLAKAEALALKLNDRRALTKALYTKALTAIDRGNKTVARAAFANALAMAEEIKLDEMQWRCLWRLGALTRQSGDLSPALDFYLRAIAALERQSAKIKIEEYRSGFIENKAELYEEAILLLLQMNRAAEAFTIAERAKSRSFADLLANADINWQEGADRELIVRRDRLQDRLSFVQGKINSLQQRAGSEESLRLAIAALSDTLSGLQKEYSHLLIDLKTANPELADMVSVEPLPLAEVQAILADSVTLVEYFFAKDKLVCWVLDRNNVRAVQTPLALDALNENIIQLRRAITKRASTENFSRLLYDQLVKPLEPLLQNARQLAIVPHGVLHYLPFPALQKADSTYLIDRYALALAPSATVLGFCQRKGSALLDQRGESYRVLALGNPDVGNARFDLPFAEKEIRSMRQTFGEIESYERRQATSGALIAGANRANLLHLSCHGVYDERNPLFSALLLAPDSTNPTGRLEAHKIFGLKLNASLVMLSACETGLARVTGGDEVIGLARGFIFAGTPSLIASLWTVDDLATAITVKRFYRYLRSGLSKAAALRAAQRFVRDHHNRHPAYWASFGLTGDWR